MKKINFKDKKTMMIIIIIIAFVFLFISLFIFSKQKDDTQQPINVQEQKPKETRSFSRVTFFHRLPEKGSLAMPEDWEGKYRVVEKENEVDFLYIGNPEKSPMLFSVRVYPDSQWQRLTRINNDEKKVLDKAGMTYSYLLGQPEGLPDKEKKEYKEMQGGVEEIIKSLKIN